jgi:hypothetical protein
MLCPTCFTIISRVRDLIIVSQMKPKILGNAFNSTIILDVELSTCKQKTLASKQVKNMVDLGGIEANLLSESKGESTNDDLDILNFTFDSTSPRVTRLPVGGRFVKATAPNLHVSNLVEKLPTCGQGKGDMLPPLTVCLRKEDSPPPLSTIAKDGLNYRDAQAMLFSGDSLDNMDGSLPISPIADTASDPLLEYEECRSAQCIEAPEASMEDPGEGTKTNLGRSSPSLKRKSLYAPSNFSKRQKRNEGPPKDLRGIFSKVAKTSSRKEVLQLLSGSPTNVMSPPNVETRSKSKV